MSEASSPIPLETAPITTQGQSHHVQLDGIRALAVLTVLIDHYFPETERWIAAGTIAVRLFFVLSGFLITGILLRARETAEKTNLPRSFVLKQFYIRRFLRIFPLFYGVLLTGLIIGLPDIRRSFPWHATYLSNVYGFLRGDVYDSVSHFWSLAVEEQFYLLWPLLILFLPKRWIMPTAIAAIITGPIFRGLMLLAGFTADQSTGLTPACLDTLGAGALLAILAQHSSNQTKKIVVSTALWIGAPMFLASALGLIFFPSDWLIIPAGLSVALSGIWLIDRAYTGFSGLTGKLLSWSPLVYLGVISYGIYILHNLVGGVATRVLKTIGLHSPSELQRAFCMSALTFLLATLSWKLYENPINRLKRYFPYTNRATRPNWRLVPGSKKPRISSALYYPSPQFNDAKAPKSVLR
jgi:peptidoglycan/LPS O-acetylase OafA/YrhL